MVASLICDQAYDQHGRSDTLREIEYLVVGGIDENLIKDFEETGNIRDLLQSHSLRRFVVNPHLGLQVLNRSNV